MALSHDAEDARYASQLAALLVGIRPDEVHPTEPLLCQWLGARSRTSFLQRWTRNAFVCGCLRLLTSLYGKQMGLAIGEWRQLTFGHLCQLVASRGAEVGRKGPWYDVAPGVLCAFVGEAAMANGAVQMGHDGCVEPGCSAVQIGDPYCVRTREQRLARMFVVAAREWLTADDFAARFYPSVAEHLDVLSAVLRVVSEESLDMPAQLLLPCDWFEDEEDLDLAVLWTDYELPWNIHYVRHDRMVYHKEMDPADPLEGYWSLHVCIKTVMANLTPAPHTR